jgi:hypothetical protein
MVQQLPDDAGKWVSHSEVKEDHLTLTLAIHGFYLAQLPRPRRGKVQSVYEYGQQLIRLDLSLFIQTGEPVAGRGPTACATSTRWLQARERAQL